MHVRRLQQLERWSHATLSKYRASPSFFFRCLRSNSIPYNPAETLCTADACRGFSGVSSRNATDSTSSCCRTMAISIFLVCFSPRASTNLWCPPCCRREFGGGDSGSLHLFGISGTLGLLSCVHRAGGWRIDDPRTSVLRFIYTIQRTKENPLYYLLY